MQLLNSILNFRFPNHKFCTKKEYIERVKKSKERIHQVHDPVSIKSSKSESELQQHNLIMQNVMEGEKLTEITNKKSLKKKYQLSKNSLGDG